LPGFSREVAFVGLGANSADARSMMAAGLRLIDADRLSDVVAVSSLYRTPPWEMPGHPDFSNAVAELRTDRSPRPLLDLCLDIESRLGRSRAARTGHLKIDIDVLLYASRSVKEVGLEIPHPRMFVRAFVLVPLAELAPDLTIRSVRVASHLTALDTNGIERLTDDVDWWKV
jgi:2-amino-4-hydroxy-6-hydroxymethyldihydropteridine diphosphokinase